MNRDTRQDRVADPLLAMAFADLQREALTELELEELRRSIGRRAELLLARKRTRWHGIVPKPLVPIAVAAGVAFALWIGPGVLADMSDSPPPIGLIAETEEDAILLEALGSDLSEQEFRLLVTGRADPEALLAFAIGNR